MNNVSSATKTPLVATLITWGTPRIVYYYGARRVINYLATSCFITYPIPFLIPIYCLGAVFEAMVGQDKNVRFRIGRSQIRNWKIIPWWGCLSPMWSNVDIRWHFVLWFRNPSRVGQNAEFKSWSTPVTRKVPNWNRQFSEIYLVFCCITLIYQPVSKTYSLAGVK